VRTPGFIAAGLVLFALPFLSVGGGGHHDASGAHMDHASRYGGLLLMVGDHHLEVVDNESDVAVYVSDAMRTPVKPAAGRLRMEGMPAIDLAWKSDRLVARGVPASSGIDYEITLADGTLLEVTAPRGLLPDEAKR
jgi:hypothetical protein